MRALLITLMTTSMLPSVLLSQTYHSGKVWVTVMDPAIIPLDGVASSNADFNQVLSDFGVSEITQPMHFARSEELRRVFELNTAFHEDSLFSALTAINHENPLFTLIEKVPVLTTHDLANPADYMWQLMLDNDTSNDWLWYLRSIEADKAWDITTSDTSIQIYHGESTDLTHPDLLTKLNPNYDFWDGDTTKQPLEKWAAHGTAVATLMAGETADSGSSPTGQLASVGYNSGILYSKWKSMLILLEASTVHNVEVINLSWYKPDTAAWYTATWKNVEKEVLDNGTIVIRGAGNGWDMIDPAYAHVPLYPFSGVEDDRVIVVSGTDKYDRFDPADTSEHYHSHYPQVDLCAPGHEIMAGSHTLDTTGNIINWPYYGDNKGTSFASPITAGTAALMKSVNPCLNSNWVQDLLKNTTDPIADASDFPGEIGTGRLNAYKAVKAAQGAYSASLDLYIKDRPEDFGYPGSYAWGWWFDKSPDIWVRNQADGFTNFIHQEPEYSSTQPVYVYVRVWNKSCDSSYGAGNLVLYWTKASSISSWPQNWDGTQPTVGNVIDSVALPNIGPGNSEVFEFQWTILNPYVHSNWASCLLARIEGISTDAITVYPNHLEQDVFENNNIALRNVTVVDIHPGMQLPVIDGIKRPHGRFMYVGNASGQPARFDLTFEMASDEHTHSVAAEAEVHIFTDEAGWQIIGSAVGQHPELKVVGDREFVVQGDSVSLENVLFGSGVRIPLYIGFNFLMDELTSEEEYHYRVAQRYSGAENDITGAVHFVIRKSPRALFNADAGADQTIRKNDSTEVNALDISEPAIYNWYDPEGHLIYSGRDTMVSPEITTTYKLEVMTDTDGFKDYDEVVIEVQSYWLEDIVPNPTIASATVTYEIEGAGSAYLMVLNGFGTVNNNYLLTPDSKQTDIDVTHYAPGVYNMILIANGQAVDARSWIIQ